MCHYNGCTGEALGEVMSESEQAKVVDGRRLRSERSRKAIIDAALELMQEGTLVATAQQVAERAGVGIRSFFRHFEDMGSLAMAIDEQLGKSWEDLFVGGDRDGSLQERLEHALGRRADAYEQLWNVFLHTAAQRWRYEVLQKNYARALRGLRKDLHDWMPELDSLSKEDREAVDAISSFEMWHRLREHQGLSKKSSIKIVTNLLRGLIPGE